VTFGDSNDAPIVIPAALKKLRRDSAKPFIGLPLALRDHKSKGMAEHSAQVVNRGATVTSADQIDKVFAAFGKDMSKCLICDGVFTRRGAATHSDALCCQRERDRESEKQFVAGDPNATFPS
jgi:D-serine deaminase-like pyridoxal phosphate-dependent protein